MRTEVVEAGLSSWPAALGSLRNDRCAAVPIGVIDRVRWSVELPGPGVDATCVDGDGTVYVSMPDALLAVRDAGIAWTVPASPFGGGLVLAGGLLVVSEPGGLAVRRQRDGGLVHLIAAPRRTLPTVAAGRLVYVQTDGRQREVRAVDLAGTVAWTHRLEGASAVSLPPLALGSHVAVADGETLRVLDAEGGQTWEQRGRSGPGWVGPLIGLPDGRMLAQYEASDEAATLLVDPLRGTVDRLPAHLPLHRPMATDGDRLALPGWNLEDSSGQPQPTLYVVSLPDGEITQRFPLHAPVASVAAGPGGTIAYAASPSLDRWTRYRQFPGFEQSTRCAVAVIRDGAGADMTVPAPITGPIAVGADGDLIVPMAGRLVSLSG